MKDSARLHPLFTELLLSSYIPNTMPSPEKAKVVFPSPKPTSVLGTSSDTVGRGHSV